MGLISNALSAFSQNHSVEITPSGAEAMKFNNEIKEKITLFTVNSVQKHGIGLTSTPGVQSRFNFYVPSIADDFVFGAGSVISPSAFSERFRIKGTGQVIIQQKHFGGYGGLLIQGNTVGSNYPNIAFSVKNAANNDIVGAMVQGELVNANTGVESIDLGFYTSSSGFASMSQKMLIRGNGNVSISGKIENEADQTPTFAGTWTNYGSGYQGAKYYKDKESRVHLSGGVSNPNIVNNSTIFTLPVGYRPASHLTFHVDTVNGTSARITVFSNGEVNYYSFNSNSNSEYGYVSLSGISFRVN